MAAQRFASLQKRDNHVRCQPPRVFSGSVEKEGSRPSRRQVQLAAKRCKGRKECDLGRSVFAGRGQGRVGFMQFDGSGPVIFHAAATECDAGSVCCGKGNEQINRGLQPAEIFQSLLVAGPHIPCQSQKMTGTVSFHAGGDGGSIGQINPVPDHSFGVVWFGVTTIGSDDITSSCLQRRHGGATDEACRTGNKHARRGGCRGGRYCHVRGCVLRTSANQWP